MGLLKDLTICGIGFTAGYYVAKEFNFQIYDEVKKKINDSATTEKRISELEERVKLYENLMVDYIKWRDKDLEKNKENGR